METRLNSWEKNKTKSSTKPIQNETWRVGTCYEKN